MRDELGTSGKAIWDAYDVGKLDAGQAALVTAYARAADTADRLDALATAREERWALLVFDEMGEVHLTIDKILDQARNANLAVRTIFAEIRQAGIKPAAASTGSTKDEEPEDMLAALRRDKERRERQSG